MKVVIKFLQRRMRMLVVGLLIIVQFAGISYLIVKLSEEFFYVYIGLWALSFLVALVVLNKRSKPEFKITWITLITLVPIFGGIFYFLMGSGYFSKNIRVDMQENLNRTKHLMPQNAREEEALQNMSKSHYKQCMYLKKYAISPVYIRTKTTYLSSGEKKFQVLKEELRQAKKFIFLEYFIISEGKMWQEILDILIEKANEGLDVRVMYDDVGCLNTLPYKYNEYLSRQGIRCKVFNPFRAKMSITMNNRDHRKIVIIDGNTGFVGGVNLADEYINAYERFGHWKDAALMVKGEAVWSLTVMFLQFWNFRKVSTENFLDFKGAPLELGEDGEGFVQPYCDSPMDAEPTGQYVFLNMINSAKEYIYIFTPYFIVENELVSAICLAAKSGVDVRMITPHIPDKKIVHMTTRSFYEELIESGVKVFEYTPGFIHSKCVVVDGDTGVVGTTNFDYRSLYHHFECGVVLYHSKTIEEIKNDFLETQKISQKITLADCQQEKIRVRIIRSLVKIFSPLM